jgi:hypothetical protein
MGLSDAMFTGDLPRRLAEVERQLRNLTSGRRLEDASVGARGVRIFDGGSLKVEGGGDITVSDEGDLIVQGGKITALDINGDTVFEVDTSVGSVSMSLGEDGSITVTGGDGIRIIEDGTLQVVNSLGIATAYFGPVSLGDDRSSGWIFRYHDGGNAFEMGGAIGAQFWAFRDLHKNIVLSSDAASGYGLAAPYLNIPMVPSSGTSVVVGGPFWPAFTNTSYQEVMHCITTLWHPKINIGVGTNASSGTVEWELRIDGTTAGGASGTTSGTFSVPGWGTTINPDGAAHSVQLWCRNTSGVQSRVIVDRCYGRQS